MVVVQPVLVAGPADLLTTQMTFVTLASWAAADTTIRLQIDWQRLGIDPAHAVIEAPEIKNFQPQQTFAVDGTIPVQKGRGWLLVIRGPAN